MENSDSLDQEQSVQTEAPAEEAADKAADAGATENAQPEEPDAEAAEEQPDADEKLAAELAQVKEKLELRADIISNVVADFLPVMDNLERALAAECTDSNYKQGVQMIYDSFMATLTKLGVTEIESDGADFNPQLHQAVQRVDEEGVESGKVAKTFAKGYKINDKVIRFAMVAVAN